MGHDGLPTTPSASALPFAGQSFGASSRAGADADLIGDTKDYCGQGPVGRAHLGATSRTFRGNPTENSSPATSVLYGAIRARPISAALPGERFAVRPIPVPQAVVEGVWRPRAANT